MENQTELPEEKQVEAAKIIITVKFPAEGQAISNISYEGIDQVSAGIVLIDLGRNLLVEAARHQHPHQH